MRRLLAWLAVTVVLLSVPLVAYGGPRLPSPSGWPLGGSVRVRRDFAPPSTPWGAGHRGVDLVAAVGDPVLAAAAGRVSFAGMLAGRGVLVVDHGDVRTTYEPVTVLAPPGTRVARGEVVARVAAGSHCRGQPCLHWGLKQGDTYLDPLSLVTAGDGGPAGPVRLVAEAERAKARAAAARRAAEAVLEALAAQQQAAAFTGAVGSGGDHGFLFPVPGAVTSGFGMRRHPVTGVWKLHDGTDFGAGCGTPIRAAYAGTVRSVGLSTGYGNRLLLDHGPVAGRSVRSGYNHATHYVVSPGQQVSRGQVLGYVGSTGYSTGCHLHLQVWLDGGLTNPMVWW